jgi:hypothetical protein
MKRKNIPLLIFGLLVYVVGIAASMTLNIFVLWANLEGQSFWGYPEALAFDTTLTTEARLSSLSCPVVLAPGEVGRVEVKVSNPNDYPIEAWISAHISKPGETENIVRELRSVSLAPGESSILRWQVDEDNIINRRMILMRVFLRLTDRHPPARTKHCGITSVDLWGLSGRSITLLALVGGHIIQAGGIWMWWLARRLSGKKNHLVHNVIIALSLLSLVMSAGSLMHSWVFSMVSLLLALLIVFTTAGYGMGMSERSSN